MFEAGSLALALAASLLGFACLALSLPRHWREVSGGPVASRSDVTTRRALGYAFLLASLALAILRDGPSFGSALGVLMLTVGAAAVALVLTWRPLWLRPLVARASAPSPAGSAPRAEAALVPIFTLTLWLTCLTVGVVGLALPRSPATPPRVLEPPPVVAELLEVALASEPPPLPTLANPPPAPPEAPPLANLAEPPPAPAMLAVAAPSPALAFALPVAGPTRVVAASQAAYGRPAETSAGRVASGPPLETLIYGQGDGKQPAPEYPGTALRAGHEGVVTIRIRVGDGGAVLAAEVSRPSPWPTLDLAALRVVRQRWAFRPGRPRLYEVAIRFELSQ